LSTMTAEAVRWRLAAINVRSRFCVVVVGMHPRSLIKRIANEPEQGGEADKGKKRVEHVRGRLMPRRAKIITKIRELEKSKINYFSTSAVATRVGAHLAKRQPTIGSSQPDLPGRGGEAYQRAWPPIQMPHLSCST